MVSKKIGLLKYSFGLVIILSILRVIIDFMNYDTLEFSPVFTSLVAGVIFAIAVIYSGTLTDFKESEKIPGDLAAAITALYQDIHMIPTMNSESVQLYKKQVRNLYQSIVDNFKSNAWDTTKIHELGKEIDQSISDFALQNASPPVLVKIRTELTTVDRISNRVKQIKDTDFIPAAYTLAEVSIGIILLIMLFLKNESTIEAILLLTSLTVISTGLILLVRDMDDPFEIGKNSSADVDLEIIFSLEQFLKE